MADQKDPAAAEVSEASAYKDVRKVVSSIGRAR